MGQQLAARCDLRLLTAAAAKHRIYTSFQFEYRYSIEQTPAFQPFERELQRLAESEARRNHFRLEESRYWEALDSCMLSPLKDALWASCEQRLRLKEVFDNRPYGPPANDTRKPSAEAEAESDADALRALDDLRHWV